MLAGHRATQEPQRTRSQPGKHQEGQRKTAHGDQAQGPAAADHEQRQRKTCQAHEQHQRRVGLQAAQVTPDDAQRRHPGQLQDRRQAEGHQQRQAHADAHEGRPGGGIWQWGVDQASQQLHKAQMHAVADQHPQNAGNQACAQKFEAITQCERALALAQHAQQGAGVELAFGKAARGQGHSHRTQQGRQQGYQIQELRGAVQGLAHFGTARVQRLDLHTAHMAGFDLVFGRLHKTIGRRSGHGHAPGHAAGRLHQTGRGQVGRVDHHAGRKVHETCATVGLAHDGGADAQLAIAQAQHLAGLQVQGFEQGGVHPDLAGRRNRGCLVRPHMAHFQTSTQGVSGLHCLERDEATGPALLCHGPRHGREADIGVGVQAALCGLLGQGCGRALVTDHHGITAQELTGIAPQAVLQAVGQKAHRRERRDRQGHRQHQEPQFARPQVAPQLASAQSESVHPSLCVHGLTIPQITITARPNGIDKACNHPVQLGLLHKAAAAKAVGTELYSAIQLTWASSACQTMRSGALKHKKRLLVARPMAHRPRRLATSRPICVMPLRETTTGMPIWADLMTISLVRRPVV